MKLDVDDLKAIGEMFDQKLEQKLEQKLDEKLDEKLKPVYDFIAFAKPALLSLLDESQEQFENKIPERVKNLENIHPGGHHTI